MTTQEIVLERGEGGITLMLPSGGGGASQAQLDALDARVDAAETDITALDGRVDGTEAAVAAHRLVSWFQQSDWDAFDVIVVNNPGDSTPVLTVDDGVGVITGGAPSAGANDRRLYVLNDPELADVADAMVYADITGAQIGIALRADSGEAVIVWINIIAFGTGLLLGGVWEFDGTSFINGNQIGTLNGFTSDVLSASGDGTRVTVRTKYRHLLTPGDIVHFDATFGGFGQVTVERTDSPTTYTFLSATTGAWSGGTYRWVVYGGRRKVAVRLQGNTLTWKQWLPGQDEPAWDDPVQAVTATLPATLAGSGLPPPTSGRIGIVAAHLNGSGQVKVNDLRVTNLDVAQPDTRAVADELADAVGVVAAQLDRVSNPSQPGVLWVADPLFFTASQALTGGTIYLAKVPVPVGRTITSVNWHVSGAASGATAGQNWVGIYSATGQRLAQTGIDSAITSTGLKTTAIGPVTVDAPHVWVALLVNASTPPSILRVSTAVSVAAANVGLPAALTRFGTGGTAQTALPSSITPASISSSGAITAPWAALT